MTVVPAHMGCDASTEANGENSGVRVARSSVRVQFTREQRQRLCLHSVAQGKVWELALALPAACVHNSESKPTRVSWCVDMAGGM
jgi:hypothetical protein